MARLDSCACMIICQGGLFSGTACVSEVKKLYLHAVPRRTVIKLLTLLHEGMAMHGKGGAGEEGPRLACRKSC